MKGKAGDRVHAPLLLHQTALANRTHNTRQHPDSPKNDVGRRVALLKKRLRRDKNTEPHLIFISLIGAARSLSVLFQAKIPPCFATIFFGRRPNFFWFQKWGFRRLRRRQNFGILRLAKIPPCFATLGNKGVFWLGIVLILYVK